MYLEYLAATLLIVAQIVAVAVLVAMIIGFIISWCNDGFDYNKHQTKWWIESKGWRLFFRWMTFPALVFGVPALVVWFS